MIFTLCNRHAAQLGSRVSNTFNSCNFSPCCGERYVSILLVFPTVSSSLPRLFLIASFQQHGCTSLMSLFCNAHLSEKHVCINKWNWYAQRYSTPMNWTIWNQFLTRFLICPNLAKYMEDLLIYVLFAPG